MGKKTERLFRDLTSKSKKRSKRAIAGLLTVAPAYYPRLLALANHPRATIRARLCAVLGELGGYENFTPRFTTIGIPTLLRLLAQDPRARVRAAAVYGIGHQVRPGMLPALCIAAGDSAKDVRRGACHALGTGLWESGVTLQQQAQVREIFLSFLTAPDAYVREWAAFYIHCESSGLDSPEIRVALWRLVDDPKDAVRAEACAALGLLGDREIVPYLLRQFESGTVWSWNLDAAVQLADPAFLPALRRLRKGYRKTHWFAKAVTGAIQDIQSRVS
jgi:HEAT repeat protein